jgi:hypothetical protein
MQRGGDGSTGDLRVVVFRSASNLDPPGAPINIKSREKIFKLTTSCKIQCHAAAILKLRGRRVKRMVPRPFFASVGLSRRLDLGATFSCSDFEPRGVPVFDKPSSTWPEMPAQLAKLLPECILFSSNEVVSGHSKERVVLG